LYVFLFFFFFLGEVQSPIWRVFFHGRNVVIRTAIVTSIRGVQASLDFDSGEISIVCLLIAFFSLSFVINVLLRTKLMNDSGCVSFFLG
jgi:hypothetical protein